MVLEFLDSYWEFLNFIIKRKGCNLIKYNFYVLFFSYKYYYYMFLLVIIYIINFYLYFLNLFEVSFILLFICKYVYVF